MHNGSEMVYKNVSYTPGLYKIFDEILVNAADNKVRDPTMDTLRVDINPVGGTSSSSSMLTAASSRYHRRPASWRILGCAWYHTLLAMQ